MKYITTVLKGTDLVFDEAINTNAVVTDRSFFIASGAVLIYRGAENEPINSPRAAIKVHRIELLPDWTANTNASQTKFISNVEVIPFIRTRGTGWKITGNNTATEQNIVFSANTNAEWELNTFSGTSEGVPNDRIYNDPFIIHPYESLFVRMHNAKKTGNNAVWASWNSDESVVSVRISYEDYNPNERYYGRVSTNDLFPIPATSSKPPFFDPAAIARGYVDLTVLDLYSNSPTLLDEPFTSLTDNNYFELDSLSFRSGYPFGGWTDSGVSATNYMYDLMVRTEDVPADLYTLRKWMSYTAGNTGAVLDFRELLKGSVRIKKGQQVFIRIYYVGSALGSPSNNPYYYRQAPAFWFDGTVPK